MHRPPTDEVLDRAQTSPIGIVLILAITLSAATAIVVVGGAALENSQEDSRIGQAEQALTQLDSRASQVALGDSDSQSVRLGTNGGNYRIDEDAGTLKIYHENWNETSDVDDEYIYGNETHGEPLGAVVYETGETTIAYQGGGVWRKDDDGGVRMVSPPEFHYRQATLTFPIVRVGGSSSVSGNAKARISRDVTARNIYPDLENNSGGLQYEGKRIYQNPVQEGNMTVEIESEYCEAWRNYFVERTEGMVTDCGDDNTVTAQIVALGTQGVFSITGGGEVRLRGMEDGHSLDTLDFEFRDSDKQKSEFNNFEWDMTGTDDEGNEIGISFERNGNIGGKFCEEDEEGEYRPVRTVIYYNNASSDNYGAFVMEQVDEDNYDGNGFAITCDGEQQVLEVDLLNESRTVTYQLLDGDDPWSPDGTLHDTEVFSEHNKTTFSPDEHGDDRETVSFSSGDEAPLDLVVQHYFGLLGDADLTISERQSGAAGISESSTGDMEYDGGGQVVTFLHVTENRIEVELH